jgi:hypothetical protein
MLHPWWAQTLWIIALGFSRHACISIRYESSVSWPMCMDQWKGRTARWRVFVTTGCEDAYEQRAVLSDASGKQPSSGRPRISRRRQGMVRCSLQHVNVLCLRNLYVDELLVPN